MKCVYSPTIGYQLNVQVAGSMCDPIDVRIPNYQCGCVNWEGFKGCLLSSGCNVYLGPGLVLW